MKRVIYPLNLQSSSLSVQEEEELTNSPTNNKKCKIQIKKNSSHKKNTEIIKGKII